MILSRRISFPLPEPHAKVRELERWYQLDSPALALAEFAAVQLIERELPELICLASPGGCNESDQLFVKSEMGSPQRFVHTLPNVRMSPFCQILRWQGPVVSLLHGPRTFGAALEEATLLRRRYRHVWVVGVRRLTPEVYCPLLFDLTAETESTFKEWIDLPDTDLWEKAGTQ